MADETPEAPPELPYSLRELQDEPWFQTAPPDKQLLGLDMTQRQWMDHFSTNNADDPDYAPLMREFDGEVDKVRESLVVNALSNAVAAGQLTEDHVKLLGTKGTAALERSDPDAGAKVKQLFPKGWQSPFQRTTVPLMVEGQQLGELDVRDYGDGTQDVAYQITDRAKLDPSLLKVWSAGRGVAPNPAGWQHAGGVHRFKADVKTEAESSRLKGEELAALAEQQKQMKPSWADPDAAGTAQALQAGAAGLSKQSAAALERAQRYGGEQGAVELALDRAEEYLKSRPELAEKIGAWGASAWAEQGLRSFLDLGHAVKAVGAAATGDAEWMKQIAAAREQSHGDFPGMSGRRWRGTLMDQLAEGVANEVLPLALTMGGSLAAGGARKLAVAGVETLAEGGMKSALTKGTLGKMVGTAELESQLGKVLADKVSGALLSLPSTARAGLENWTQTMDAAAQARGGGNETKAQELEDNAMMNFWAGMGIETLTENIWLNEMWSTRAGRPLKNIATDVLERRLGSKGAELMGRVGDAIQTSIASAGQEGLEEVLAGIGGRAWMNEFAAGNQDLMEGVPAEFLTGAVVGGLAGTARTMAQSGRPEVLRELLARGLDGEAMKPETMESILAAAREKVAGATAQREQGILSQIAARAGSEAPGTFDYGAAAMLPEGITAEEAAIVHAAQERHLNAAAPSDDTAALQPSLTVPETLGTLAAQAALTRSGAKPATLFTGLTPEQVPTALRPREGDGTALEATPLGSVLYHTATLTPEQVQQAAQSRETLGSLLGYAAPVSSPAATLPLDEGTDATSPRQTLVLRDATGREVLSVPATEQTRAQLTSDLAALQQPGMTIESVPEELATQQRLHARAVERSTVARLNQPRMSLSKPKPKGMGKTAISEVKAGDIWGTVRTLFKGFRSPDQVQPATGNNDQIVQQVHDMLASNPVVRDADGLPIRMDNPEAVGPGATGLLRRVWHLLAGKGKSVIDNRRARTALSVPTTLQDYHVKVLLPSRAVAYLRTYSDGTQHAVVTVELPSRERVVIGQEPVTIGLETQFPLDPGLKSEIERGTILKIRTESSALPSTASGGVVPGAHGPGSTPTAATNATSASGVNPNIKSSRPVGNGKVSITTAQAEAAVRMLSQKPEGKAVVGTPIIVADRSQLDEANYHPEDWASFEAAEGFFDPRTKQVVILASNVEVRSGETPSQAVARVLLHERVGHEGLESLRKADSSFRMAWEKLAREIPDTELQRVAESYPELAGDKAALAEEWFAHRVGELESRALPKESSTLRKMWEALKSALKRLFMGANFLPNAYTDGALDAKVIEMAAQIRIALKQRAEQQANAPSAERVPAFIHLANAAAGSMVENGQETGVRHDPASRAHRDPRIALELLRGQKRGTDQSQRPAQRSASTSGAQPNGQETAGGPGRAGQAIPDLDSAALAEWQAQTVAEGGNGPFDGEEHDVFRDKVTGRAVKFTKQPAFTGGVEAYLERLVWANEHFGDAIRVEGWFTDATGSISLVTTQPWIDGRQSTLGEIESYMRHKGFVRAVDGVWRHRDNEDLWITDLMPKNSITDDEGHVTLIDFRKPIVAGRVEDYYNQLIESQPQPMPPPPRVRLSKAKRINPFEARDLPLTVQQWAGLQGPAPFRVDNLSVRQLLTGSALPSILEPLRQQSVRDTEAVQQSAAQLGRDLETAMQSYATRLAMPLQAVNNLVEQAMAGTIPMAALGDAVLEERARRARNFMDDLSIAVGNLTGGNLGNTIMGNLGNYMRRSYAAFDPQSNWNYDNLKQAAARNELIAGQPARQILQDAENWLSVQHPQHNAGQIEALMRELMDRDSVGAALTGAPQGKISKDVSSLMRRKDIPEPLRRLMGEERNPIKRFLSTAGFQAQFIARHEQQVAMRNIGLALGLFSTQQTGVHHVRVGGEDGAANRRWSGFAGVWTTPELLAALQSATGALSPADLGGVLVNALKFIGGEAKLNKVALNPDSWMVNIMGNLIGLVQTGDLVGLSGYQNLARAVEMLRSGKAKKGDVVNLAQEQIQDARRQMMSRLAAAGVANSSFNMQDMEASLDNRLHQFINASDAWNRTAGAARGAILGDAFGRPFGTIGRLVGAAAGGVGGAVVGGQKIMDVQRRIAEWTTSHPDRIGKITAFFGNYEANIAAGMAEAVAFEAAAEKTLNTLPDYSHLPDFMRQMSRLGLMGSFIAFQFEVYRNTYWNARYAVQELTSGNPALMQRGAKRLLGLSAVLGGAAWGLQAFVQSLFGIGADDEKDQAYRRSLGAPWERHGKLAFTHFDAEKASFFNTSYLLPQVTLLELISAGSEGKDLGEALAFAAEQLKDQFLNGSVHLDPILEAATNSRRIGGKVSFAPDGTWTQLGERLDYVLFSTLEPGATNKLDRVLRSEELMNRPRYGRSFNLEEEAKRLLGVRQMTYSHEERIKARLFEFRDRYNDARQGARAEYRENSPGAATTALMTANATITQIQADWDRFRNDMRTIGVPDRVFETYRKAVAAPKTFAPLEMGDNGPESSRGRTRKAHLPEDQRDDNPALRGAVSVR